MLSDKLVAKVAHPPGWPPAAPPCAAVPGQGEQAATMNADPQAQHGRQRWRAHRSTAELQLVPAMRTSGATQAKVPTGCSWERKVRCRMRDTPTSASLATPRVVSSTLCDLTARGVGAAVGGWVSCSGGRGAARASRAAYTTLPQRVQRHRQPCTACTGQGQTCQACQPLTRPAAHRPCGPPPGCAGSSGRWPPRTPPCSRGGAS